MKYQEANFGVHHPPTRMALVFNLIVGPEMPLAVHLSAPKRIIVARVCRPDLARIVGTTLSCNASVLHLNLFPSRDLWRMAVGIGWPRFSYITCSGGSVGGDLAIHKMVRGRSRGCSRRINMRRVAIAGHCVVVGPLIWEIEVSKRVQRAIQVEVVIAIATAVIRIDVVGSVGVVEERTGVVYHRLTGAHGVVGGSNACIADAQAIAASDDACRWRSVWGLASIGEDTSLTIAGSVDVLVARLWIRLHCCK